ncbi:MAG: T9SS type A sorting domain-containing protein [Bacteroidetes bacterium]|nr:T9SS type A sorting domain-containing protein [Bacteroidota bacterium]
MKRILSIFLLLFLSANFVLAQLQDGTIAPDWTLNDINNTPYTLYNYLNNDKVVFLDFSATWCGPCWNYHNSHAFKGLYEQHGPPGTNNVMAFMIEADATTNLACLHDWPNCSGAGTWGDWVTGTPYPIIDYAGLNSQYAINYFPTLYAVCPSKKIYEVSQMGSNDLWEVAKWCSAPDLYLGNLTNINCYGESNGAISVDISDGMPPFTFLWNNGATTQSISNLPAGNYTLTVTGSLGGTKTLGPITVAQPAAPLSISSTTIQPEGCAGMGGEIEIQVAGGSPSYNYQWSNGANGPINAGLTAGTYSVSITDIHGCSVNQTNMVVAPPAYPLAFAAAPTTLTCNTPSFTLNGNGSSTGSPFTYLWTTSDGYILSGANTLNNCLVNAAGTYQLLVQNANNNCMTFASTVVTANQTAPDVTAGPPGNISCSNAQTTLNAVGPTGQNFNLLWTTIGGNIVSGATTLNPVVNAAGTYTLTITNLTNGCSSSSTTNVTSSISSPNIGASGGVLTCTNSNVTLSGSSSTPNVGFAWTGPNGFTSTQQNPIVAVQGTYVLTVTNPANGCTATASATVSQNTNAPQASAQGGVITCANSNVTLSGSSTTQNVIYSWVGPNGFTSSQQNPAVNVTGNYVLTVTGSNGCTQTATGIVSQNTTPPIANAGPSGILNCHANQVVLNGTSSSSGSQFAYQWTTSDGHIAAGANTLTPTVDNAGNYLLTVTNNNSGCTNTATTSVVQRQSVVADVASQINVTCNGGATGSATAAGNGGNGSYTYAWSNGTNAATANNLSAGTYSVVVTDGENCEATKTVTITQPNPLQVNASTTAQSAPGVNNGTATANPQGGTGNYTFQWSNGENSQTITDLSPGNYTVVVTDENGCQKMQTVTVNVFGCAVSATINAQDATCNGSDNGSASINLTNAAAPTTFLWSNGAQTQTATDLAPGNYSVTASDGNGCEVVADVEISEPNPLTPNATTTGLTAINVNDGTATASPTGGTAPFSFEWSTGETSASITGLSSANYTVSIEDANGCTAVQTVPVAPFTCSLGANLSANDISCFGQHDGQATVSILGNLTPFTYVWENAAGENIGATATIEGLSAGTYTISVADAVNCAAMLEVTILEPAALELSLIEVAGTDCGATNGQATVSATGGIAVSGYNFVWSNGMTNAAISNLEAGTYTVSATDDNGCEANLEVEVKINDVEPPVALAQNLTISLDADGKAEVDASQVDNGSTDNCTIASMTIDQTSFDCSQLGTNQIVLTVVDEAGNSNTATANVQVVDNVAPTINVQDFTVYLDENGTASITPQMLDEGSTDNCSIAAQSIDITNFTCANLGQNAVVLTIEDESGNMASGTAIVTVLDNIAPTITCPNDMLLAFCDPVGVFNLDVSDNCAQNLVPTLLTGLPSGETFPIGTTVQTFEVNDGHGNHASCSFNIVVPAAMQVDLTSNNIACFGETSGSATVSVSGGSQTYNYAWSNGTTTSTVENLEAGPISVTVTDAAGCTIVETAEITQPTEITAVMVQTIPETVGQENGAIDMTVAGGTAPLSFEWRDAWGNVVGNQEDLVNVAAGIYYLIVTDANGCTLHKPFAVQAVTPVTNRQLERRIMLFPNPTSRLVTVAFDEIDALEANIQLFDMTGKLTEEYPHADVSSGIFVLDLGEFPEGMFLVKVMIENQVVVKRVVVQK